MVTLVEFLTARLNEDEKLARDCIAEVGPERAGERFTDDSGDATQDAFPSYPWGSQESELQYMAGAGHPARVLADVAAKREIVAELVEQDGDGTSGEGTAWRLAMAAAAVYADHPDYSPSHWKP